MASYCRSFALLVCALIIPASMVWAQITEGDFQSSRLKTHFRESGNPQGQVALFIHGNLVSSVFWTAIMERMPPQYHCFAVDLRGFGDSETKPVDATRGVRDWSDDVFAFLAEQSLVGSGKKVHMAGWSMGGLIAMQYAVDHSETLLSLMLVDPISPYGFLATKDAAGTPNYADFAGSGSGTTNPEFLQRIASRDTTTDSPFSPLNIMRNFFFKPPFIAPNERELLAGILKSAVGDDNFPGDVVPSANWPFVAPGVRGTQNAFSPKYANTSSLINIPNKFPILWVRGAKDQVISDSSFFDLGHLVTIGALDPAFLALWPGKAVFPAQPMDTQTRSVLNQYQANGGSYTEVEIADAGHTPIVEKPDEVMIHYSQLLQSTTSVAASASENLSTDFRLEANYPNPFNPGTKIEFEVARASHVHVEIFNLLGEKIKTLVSEALKPGKYAASFDGTGLAGGVYLYRLEAGNFSTARKMLLLK
ncbi:MAG: alpha/beta fold hydrolase [candidate division KSB1 bacterium]|nr:alpha/beta fold hydrolase [candidate division KSB1 bacterium]MDZ7273325.1 alpha/beta fold hydrolase [candidate division KSB1 bacterium]MDZ7285429.1 alpha/beta fold hydrolase [candidate division KSB1 bacterium]MDZ7298460.1 alpha/beta fold hydrolase [candidate division KSB1 bacterium]MDZ7348907.1 alpha/beta fold hydrolase [candidate division KSB1 bacterium]